MKPRRVDRAVLSVEQSEGVGARVRRSIGRKELKNLDPFLMLDEFRVSKPAGFPDHPHRGFETVPYYQRRTCFRIPRRFRKRHTYSLEKNLLYSSRTVSQSTEQLHKVQCGRT